MATIAALMLATSVEIFGPRNPDGPNMPNIAEDPAQSTLNGDTWAEGFSAIVGQLCTSLHLDPQFPPPKQPGHNLPEIPHLRLYIWRPILQRAAPLAQVHHGQHLVTTWLHLALHLLKSPGKNNSMSSSDRFPLKPTGENQPYSSANESCKALGPSRHSSRRHASSPCSRKLPRARPRFNPEDLIWGVQAAQLKK